VELTHEFTVPAPLEETWAAFDDIAAIGQCFPGAQVTEVQGDTFTGTVKVKLGPIALVYKGTGTFTEKDEAARTMTIEAKGKDKRGNGTAGADVVARMEAVGEVATRVTVRTDLSITGKPAQFGRGVIQDVSDKLLGQFVDCLAGRIGSAGGAEAADQDAGAASVPAGAAADGVDGADPDAGPASVPSGAAADSSVGTAAGAGPADGGTHRAATSSGSGGDTLDLGPTVIPILVRSYGKQLAAGAGILAVLLWLLRRRG
jgi:carbon monoxide dehydrogenase subunit G